MLDYMLDYLIDLDKWLFVTINGFNSPFIDPIMIFFSKKIVWIPLYIIIAIWLFTEPFLEENGKLRFKRRAKNFSFLFLIGIILTFALTDSIANNIKELFERSRPCWDESLSNVCRLLESKGGQYGFVSNHASNVFGMALFSSLIFRKKWFSILIFIWAIFVAYSRIYVGKHFPADVLFGALLGMLIALLTYKIISYIYRIKR